MTYQVKAFEEHRFRPTYAGANVGHPSFQKATLEPEEYDYVACHLFCHINWLWSVITRTDSRERM